MNTFLCRRPAPSARSFCSPSVERLIDEVTGGMADRELAWLFRNAFPNTLDTTIAFTSDGPDTFVITGDIPAMWLRDSTAQVWPFLPLAAADEALRALLEGVIRRQARSLLLDPYANAFYPEPVLGRWKDDLTAMRPGVHERKWELDSLAYFFRLSYGFWKATGDRRPFGGDWKRAVAAAFDVLRTEQGEGAASTYRFGRPGDTLLPREGRGAPSADCGLIRCAFRPSDDEVVHPFLVPANAMAAGALQDLSLLLREVNCAEMAGDAEALAGRIQAALETLAVVDHPHHGPIWAYEVDGLGSVLCMDDANVPSLLAFPYLGICPKDDPRYLRTRNFCLSRDNPSYVASSQFAGIGSPHTPPGSIWPMALVIQALTAEEDEEITRCLTQLKHSHAGTGLMHESFDAADPSRFTRPWFAWANTLFGELIVRLFRERPHLLERELK